MKKVKSTLASLLIALSIVPASFVAAGTTTFGNKWAGASSTESAQYFYTGEVHFYPKRTNIHMGTVKYSRNGKTVASNQTAYIPVPATTGDNYRAQATVTATDSLSLTGPKTIFNYNFSY